MQRVRRHASERNETHDNTARSTRTRRCRRLTRTAAAACRCSPTECCMTSRLGCSVFQLSSLWHQLIAKSQRATMFSSKTPESVEGSGWPSVRTHWLSSVPLRRPCTQSTPGSRCSHTSSGSVARSHLDLHLCAHHRPRRVRHLEDHRVHRRAHPRLVVVFTLKICVFWLNSNTIFKVRWVFLERTRILSGIHFTMYFIDLFFVATKPFVGSFVHVILTRHTFGQHSSTAADSVRRENAER